MMCVVFVIVTVVVTTMTMIPVRIRCSGQRFLFLPGQCFYQTTTFVLFLLRHKRSRVIKDFVNQGRVEKKKMLLLLFGHAAAAAAAGGGGCKRQDRTGRKEQENERINKNWNGEYYRY